MKISLKGVSNLFETKEGQKELVSILYWGRYVIAPFVSTW